MCACCARLLQGVGRPDEVLACVEAGVDLFESFFPFQVTERGCALYFDFDINPDPERAGTAPPSGVLQYCHVLTPFLPVFPEPHRVSSKKCFFMCSAEKGDCRWSRFGMKGRTGKSDTADIIYHLINLLQIHV